MNGIERDRRGREFLAELATDPESDCWRQFDSLFYEGVWRYLRIEHKKLAARVARFLNVEGVVAPEVLPEEVDEVAHLATQRALRRVREKASGFDPQRGTPTKWVIGAAVLAWVEVAKEIVKSRRSDKLVFVDPADLVNEPDRALSTDEHVLRHLEDEEALADAASHVSEKEFVAIRLVLTGGYSYAEAAEVIFGDASMTKQVDGLLTRGKRKLAEAWVDRKPSPRGVGDSNLSDHTADKGESNG